ncbi:uncharacterized protein LOC124287724 [Haliotis rubra]|uniref:uncharacterized protein LOC124287724 n=1 Tax=Haliotis rubra TaxID=36100 RepID=UPI001EE52EBA|nr:uncharacterized protein LOC124287724 [Haliotis rubra]XP_046580216.1 uncharacterized protein LOC124287724 [Haliotis rubra]
MSGISVVTQTMITPRRFTCWTGREQLKPAVQDLSGQLRPPTRSLSSSSDEDGNGNYLSFGPQGFLSERHNALTCRPFLTQRQTSRSAGMNTQRGDNCIHRQTVQRSARLRSRLSYTRSRSADQMLNTVANKTYDSEELLSLQVAKSVDRSRDSMQGHMYTLPSSRMSQRDIVVQPRPATTTGRYFDSANGLRCRNMHQNRRPQTAGSWLASGLKIQRIKLQSKNDFGLKLEASVKER